MNKLRLARPGLTSLACTFLILTACSSGADEKKALSLVVKDGHFAPENLDVPAGQKFKLTVKNEGTTAEEFESSDLSVEKVITPGGQAELTLGPLEAGSYRFIGEFHRDTAKGQLIAK